MHFVHKFKNSLIFLSISYDERGKEVLFKRGGRINIHCKTIESELYLFTISGDYAKSPFHLLHLLKIVKNLRYETLMKEIEV
jgi:hypothetical protein